jgi:hypothetical protein
MEFALAAQRLWSVKKRSYENLKGIEGISPGLG